ncbi:hypothetical protein QQF64_035951 [Cirrhinus molitorella]|uniref:Pyrin domain-containing protein n=1 Tax=Cirrhinus molitorella TaxID=172907 RepID=A0ABR3NH72_9TELE
MASVKDLLMDSLQELKEAELEVFHWHLANEYKCIPKCKVEKAKKFDTVDTIVACFGPEEAVKVMVKMLRKINQMIWANNLENEHKQAQAEGNKNTSLPVGVHVFLCYLNKNMQELQFFFDEPKQNIILQELLQNAVDKARRSQRGHLDLFLRFLMGISLESSQNLLKGLFTHSEDTTESIAKTTEYIKKE